MYKALNSKQRDVMINCLLLANHEGKTWEWKGKLFKCKPGQFITSLNSLKKVCADDVTIRNIRTALDKLEKWGFLTNESTKTGRLITIVNWEKYQSKDKETDKDTDKEMTNDRQSTDKALTTNKNDKELYKNDKEYKKNIYSPAKKQDSIPYKEIVDYLNMRTGSQYRSSTQKTRELIRARWNEGFELDDFKTVIDKKCVEWIGTDMEKYLRPVTLFGTKFESYLNQLSVVNKQNNSKRDKQNDALRRLYQKYKEEEESEED